MTKFILPPGKLHSQSTDNEASYNIEIVTLTQAKREAVSTAAWLDLTVKSISDIDNYIEKAMEKETHFQEFILMEGDNITVGVNFDTINDIAVTRAMNMLTTMDTYTINSYKNFGI